MTIWYLSNENNKSERYDNIKRVVVVVGFLFFFIFLYDVM